MELIKISGPGEVGMNEQIGAQNIFRTVKLLCMILQ